MLAFAAELDRRPNRIGTASRLVFTDGEKWRLRLLLLPESGEAGATLDRAL